MRRLLFIFPVLIISCTVPFPPNGSIPNCDCSISNSCNSGCASIDSSDIRWKNDTTHYSYRENELVITIPDSVNICSRYLDLDSTQLNRLFNHYGGLPSGRSTSRYSFGRRQIIDVTGFCKEAISLLIRNGIRTNLADTLSNPDFSRDTVNSCLCDRNIFLYENPLIKMEEGEATASARSGIGGEGGIPGQISLNYLIEIRGDMPPPFAPPVESLIQDWSFVYKEDMARTETTFYNQFTHNVKDLKANEGPIVAFLDTGLDPRVFDTSYFFKQYSNTTCLTNDELGWNFIENNNQTYDSIGHGTLVARSFKKPLDQHNIAKNYKVLPVKVLDDCGYGSVYSVVCGLYYAAEKGANIVNTSWGLYFHNEQIFQAVNYLNDQNIIVVSSAGNSSIDLENQGVLHFPSGYGYNFIDSSGAHQKRLPNVIEVSGLCNNYNDYSRSESSLCLWDGSNKRDTVYFESAIYFENLINSLVTTGLATDSIYCTLSGTSYAAPMTSAAIVTCWDSGFNQSHFLNGLTIYDNYNNKRRASFWVNRPFINNDIAH